MVEDSNKQGRPKNFCEKMKACEDLWKNLNFLKDFLKTKFLI